MIIVENSIIPFGTFKAMTIGPWVFCKDAKELSDIDLNHEAIHWEQQKETLVIGFWILYIVFFLIELVRCSLDNKRGRQERRRNPLFKRAYRMVAFEREAYTNEGNLQYIPQRKHWSWIHYFH